jgi:16S rRNA (cytidine1402-2'-O)-methyltransferase
VAGSASVVSPVRPPFRARIVTGCHAAPAGEEEIETALREAMARLSPSRAAAEVAERLGVPRRDVYDRAQKLK